MSARQLSDKARRNGRMAAAIRAAEDCCIELARRGCTVRHIRLDGDTAPLILIDPPPKRALGHCWIKAIRSSGKTYEAHLNDCVINWNTQGERP